MARRLVLAVMLAIVAILTGCAMVPPMPRPPPLTMPNADELMRQMMEAQGRGEAPAEAVDDAGVQVVFQTGHTSSLSAVALSADGRHIVSGGVDEQTRVWDVASGQETRAIAGSGLGWPRRVGFTADGSRFFVEGFDGVSLYDRQQGTKLSGSRSPTISEDGRVRVDSEQGRGMATPVLVDAASGVTVAKFPGSGILKPAALSGDADTVVVRELKADGNQVGSILKVWRVSSRKVVDVEDVGQQVFILALSAHGRWLALEDARRDVVLVDANTGKVARRLSSESGLLPAMTNSLVFSPDELQIARATGDGHATLWSVSDGSVTLSIEASALNFSVDGRTLVLGGAQGGAPWLRDIASGAETRLSASAAKIADLAIADEGAALIAASADGMAKQWDAATGELTHAFMCAAGLGAWSVATSHSAPLLALGCMDGSVTLLNRATGQRVAQVLPASKEGPAFTAVAFARSAQLPGVADSVLVAASRDEVVVWDIASSTERRRFKLSPGNVPPFAASAEEVSGMSAAAAQAAKESMQHVRTLAVDPTGRLLAVGRSYDVCVWDLESGQLVRRMGASALTADDAPDASSSAAKPMTPAEMKKAFGRSGGGLLSGMKPGSGRSSPNATVYPGDPMQVTRELAGSLRGASHLAFSGDGRRLFADGATWDVASGRDVTPQTGPTFDPMNPQALMASMRQNMRREGEHGPIAVSADGRWLAHAAGRVVRILDASTEREVFELKGHRGTVDALAFSPDSQRLFSGGEDGAVRVWALPDGKQLVALISLGAQDFVAVTPDQYYRVSKARLSGVAFRQGDTLYPFEQFDLKFNRPDILLERLGRAPAALVQSYRQSYQRRLSKLGFTEAALTASLSLPRVSLNETAVPVTTAAASLSLSVHADDASAALQRFNLFVNDVPVYGTRGLAIEGSALTVDRRVDVPLARGRNKIQVSVLNARGVESLRQTVYTTSTGERAPADVWIVAIGVSQYQRSQYSLRYAAKDAADVADVFRALGDHTHVLNLSNSDATRQGIESARRWLEQAKADDLVVVFAAGHGMTDVHQNYYFGTYDIDPDEPSQAGLPFESFENLLDGIAPLRKLLLVDTCFSGEIDKDEPAPLVANAAAADAGSVVVRSFKAARGVSVVADDSGRATSSVRFQQDWFADLRRGTGAVVISSASGSEYALEGEQWNNGVFTYALLDGLKNHAADANGDKEITVGELQAYVSLRVVELTRGGQNPTVRRENLSYDFTVF